MVTRYLLSIVFAFLGDDHKEAKTAINAAPSHQITPHMCQHEVLTIGVDVEGCREASALDLCHFLRVKTLEILWV